MCSILNKFKLKWIAEITVAVVVVVEVITIFLFLRQTFNNHLKMVAATMNRRHHLINHLKEVVVEVEAVAVAAAGMIEAAAVVAVATELEAATRTATIKAASEEVALAEPEVVVVT